MSVGLLGGAFDPPHNGHLALARAAIDHFDLERLIVIPTGEPPHKAAHTDGETRFRLAEAAFAGLPRVELSQQELKQPGPSYTVATARWAARELDDPIFLVGADEFCDFLTWREPDAILEEVRLGVASRPGFPRERLEMVLHGLERRERVELFEIAAMPVESRDLRIRVGRGEPIDDFVPAAVARLIAELGLYRD